MTPSEPQTSSFIFTHTPTSQTPTYSSPKACNCKFINDWLSCSVGLPFACSCTVVVQTAHVIIQIVHVRVVILIVILNSAHRVCFRIRFSLMRLQFYHVSKATHQIPFNQLQFHLGYTLQLNLKSILSHSQQRN